MLDDPGVHHGHPVGDGHGLLLVVGDIDGGDAHTMLDLFDDGTHFHPEFGVQVGEGFIH